MATSNRPEVAIDWRVYTKDPSKPLIRDLIIEGLSLARIFHCSVVVVSLDSLKYSLITGDTVNSVNSSCVIFSINERLPND